MGTASAQAARAWSAWSEPQTLVLQLPWSPGFQFAGYYAAEDKGFFRDAGLKVEIRHSAPGADAFDEVLTGRAHFGVGSADLLLYRANGSPVVSLAPIFQRLPSILLVRADSNIETARDLAGRRVMMDLSGPNLAVRRILHQAGITLDRVETVPHTGNLEDLIAGRVDAYDAYVSDEPAKLERRGIAYRMFAPDESAVPWYGDVLFTLESMVDQRPRRTAAFQDAVLRGWRYALQFPEETLDLVARRCGPSADRAYLEYEAAALRPLIGHRPAAIGRQNEDRWRQMADEMAVLGAITAEQAEALNYDRFVYDTDHHGREVLRQYRVAILWLFVPALLIAAFGLWRLTRKVKQRSVALRESEARCRQLFDNAPLMIFVGRVLRKADGSVDDCRLLDVNRVVAQAANRPRAEIRGRLAREIWPDSPLDPQTLERLDRVAVLRKPDTMEYYSFAFGRNLRVQGFPADPGCFAAIVEDVTASWHLELLLRVQLRVATARLMSAAPEELGLLIEDGLKTLPVADCGGIYVLDPLAEPAALRLAHAWGVSDAYRTAVERIPFASPAGRLFASGRAFTLGPGPEWDALPDHPLFEREGLQAIASFPLMDGAECLGCLSLASRAPRAFSPDLIEALSGIARHAAERLARARAERALRESEAGFRRLAENIRAAIFIVRADGRVAYANEAAAQRTGRPREEILASNWGTLFCPDAVRTLERQASTAAAGWRYEIESHLQGARGDPMPVELIATAIPWRSDLAILIIARDLSWQRRLEEEISRIARWEREKLNRELHDGVAQDIVAASLLFETAHLGTPAERETRAGQIRQLFRQSLDRMRQLMRGLESLDAGEERLADALRSLAERISGTFGVDCRFDERAPPASVDRGVNGHLFYIVREAVMNAVRHGQARRILILLTRTAAGGLRLVVENDGTGFDPVTLQSPGFGLRIMRYRAERIGAELRIESPNGRGARVTVERAVV